MTKPRRIALGLALLTAAATARAGDRLRALQEGAIATKDQKLARAYHFGSQGAGDVYSNHESHANRLVPVYAFGRKLDLGAVTGKNSRYRTADGAFRPVAGIGGKAEAYTSDDLRANPTLASMTEAAIAMLSSRKTPFALFVEAGEVDWALHDNNLDNAVGAIFSGEEAVKAIVAWVEAHSNWDESALIVTSDHGHYLVVEDPQALIGAKGERAARD